MAIKTGDEFTITYKMKGDDHVLVIAPTVENKGYPEKEVQITLEQWNELRFHFATKVNDKEGLSRLAYIH